MSYAFTFDASACSGCKACQEACKDKNGLPTGVLWRRVIEVSGGGWQARGAAWENSIFAYNLSLACNHCTHPKCAGLCPTQAYSVREDGIVLLDSSKCMGCGYCAWACPYAAPQYDLEQGVMTKCDFCADNMDAGLPPACVAACPLRVLNFGSLGQEGILKGGLELWQLPGAEHPFPLPTFSRTEPHLALKPHPAMQSSQEKTVANREEILPPGSIDHERGMGTRHGRLSGRHELPLVAFTLLAQISAGLALSGVIMPLPRPALLATGILLGVGGLISFLHLGRKSNAWRAVAHLRKSWLSREILMAGLFGFAWLVTAGWQAITAAPANPWPMAILGIGLVYSMGCVYRLRAVPSWNSWRTQAAFFLSAIILGMLAANLVTPQPGWMAIASAALAADIAIALAGKRPLVGVATMWRVILLVICLAGALLLILSPALISAWSSTGIFVLALAGQVAGRWQFYSDRMPFPLRTD